MTQHAPSPLANRIFHVAGDLAFVILLVLTGKKLLEDITTNAAPTQTLYDALLTLGLVVVVGYRAVCLARSRRRTLDDTTPQD